jgi:hypothetical protein
MAPMGQLAFGCTATEYRPRAPEQTVLYKTVANHIETFFAMVEGEGRNLPKFVRQEFDAYLRCGIHAYGFLRLRCNGCHTERLVAFSCKKRGFCTSCGGRRMSESAAHLIDEVFPKVGVRQWVVSFPFAIRFLLLRSPALQSRVLGICIRAINSLIQQKAKRKLNCGAVTLLQRFGGSLNANLHFHILVLEGGYTEGESGPEFVTMPRLEDEDIQALVQTIAKRVVRALKKLGHFGDESEALSEDAEDPLAELQAASVRSRVALGKRRGEWIRRIGSLGVSDAPELNGPLCASVAQFSLHANVYCAPEQRDKLEKLCRYVARPAVAEERLKLKSNGDVLLRLKKPYGDGTSHLVFSPLEFLEKLAALVPPPRAHLTRFHGVLAPHSKIRSKVVPKVQPKQEGEAKVPKKARMGWAKLLKRVFGIDMENCACGGKMEILAAIMEGAAIEKILKHLGRPYKPPDVAPARYPEQATLEF